MRALAAFAVLVLAAVPARADDASTQAMEGVADVAAACAALREGTTVDLPCTRVGRVVTRGGAIAELYEIGEPGQFARWTIVIDDHGALSRSPTLEAVFSNCGSQKCLDAEASRPPLRKIRRGAAVSIELWTRFELDVQTPAESGHYKTVESWHTYDALECGPDPSGVLACTTRHRDGRRPLD
jgi:hypothetical protein